MKMPVEWHEECAQARSETCKRLREVVYRAQEDLRRAENEMYVLVEQINEAKRRGKDGFDAERFLVPRKKKS